MTHSDGRLITMQTDGIYSQFLALNETAFSQGLFTAAYHALSGALYCALEMKDLVKRTEVEQRAAKQLEYLKVHFARDGDSQDGLTQEPLELVLYGSLLRVANPRRVFSANESF